MGLSQSDRNKLYVSPLQEEGTADLKKFKCSDKEFEQFLQRKSRKHEETLLAKTYLLYYKEKKEEKGEIVGFYTLSSASLSATEEIKLNFKSGKLYSDYPAVRIGRLAISKDYEGKGFGRHILDYVKGQLVYYNEFIGCRYLIVNALNDVSEFYLKAGFSYYTEKDEKEKTRLMYFDLLSVLKEG